MQPAGRAPLRSSESESADSFGAVPNGARRHPHPMEPEDGSPQPAAAERDGQIVAHGDLGALRTMHFGCSGPAGPGGVPESGGLSVI